MRKVTVYLSDTDAAAIEASAHAVRLSTSSWIRLQLSRLAGAMPAVEPKGAAAIKPLDIGTRHRTV